MGSLPRSSQFVTIFVTGRPDLRLSFIFDFFRSCCFLQFELIVQWTQLQVQNNNYIAKIIIMSCNKPLPPQFLQKLITGLCILVLFCFRI